MSDWRKVDKKIAFLSQFKANEPAPTSAEKMGPPSPWELYRASMVRWTPSASRG